MRKKCLLGQINKISFISSKYIEKKIKEEKLPILLSHVMLFFILPEDGSPMIFNQIANVWQISKSSLSDIINKYENQGLIKKCICNSDKRSAYVSLEPEAIILRQKLQTIEDEFLGSMLKNFNLEERQDFEENVDKALKNIEKMI